MNQLAYLTHTSIQFIDKNTWETTVTQSHKKVSTLQQFLRLAKCSLLQDRGYYIGLALEFKEYVVAFLSLDQVFQVC